VFFFGRDRETDELVRLLSRARLVSVVGASGSGKSSLVRAGLLPALRGGLFAEAGSRWRVATLRPGDDPMGNLARSIIATEALGHEKMNGPEQEAFTEAVLRRGALGLVDAVQQARLPPGENLLIVVERFEDLFRVAPANDGGGRVDDASAFVSLLLEAARQAELPVYIVLILRAGYLGDCARFQGLPEVINDGMHLIPRLTRDEAREAITGPVRVCRAEVAPRLVERLLNDAGNDPRGLPAFQHAMMCTWEAWRSEGDDVAPVDLRHYEEAGGVGVSLSRRADEAFDDLADVESRAVAEKLFKALARECGVGKGFGEVVKLKSLCEKIGAGEQDVMAVVETFRREGRSFLRPPAALPLTGESLVEISYEDVIHSWSRLKSWAGGAERG
jgi:AAA ATPase domain